MTRTYRIEFDQFRGCYRIDDPQYPEWTVGYEDYLESAIERAEEGGNSLYFWEGEKEPVCLVFDGERQVSEQEARFLEYESLLYDATHGGSCWGLVEWFEQFGERKWRKDHYTAGDHRLCPIYAEDSYTGEYYIMNWEVR